MESSVRSGVPVHFSLNPYYNGRYSWRVLSDREFRCILVLILIIMEDTHGALEGVQ